MILQCDDADESCGFPGDEGTIGKECGESAELTAETVLSRRGLFTDKGKRVIFTLSKQYENDTSMTGSKRRRSRRWIHLDRSYG